MSTAAKELQRALDSQPRPDCAALTPFEVEEADFDVGRVVLRFAPQPAFKNHFGNVLGQALVTYDRNQEQFRRPNQARGMPR
jgi:glutamyl/glutaminyl-tRNA synthetase